jgi:hypothetical protein
VQDHRPAVDVGERFSRQPAGGHPRRYDNDGSQARLRGFRPAKNPREA